MNILMWLFHSLVSLMWYFSLYLGFSLEQNVDTLGSSQESWDTPATGNLLTGADQFPSKRWTWIRCRSSTEHRGSIILHRSPLVIPLQLTQVEIVIQENCVCSSSLVQLDKHLIGTYSVAWFLNLSIIDILDCLILCCPPLSYTL